MNIYMSLRSREFEAAFCGYVRQAISDHWKLEKGATGVVSFSNAKVIEFPKCRAGAATIDGFGFHADAVAPPFLVGRLTVPVRVKNGDTLLFQPDFINAMQESDVLCRCP